MREEVRNELNEAILDCLDTLQNVDTDSKEYADICNNLSTLVECLKDGEDSEIRALNMQKELENAKIRQLSLEKELKDNKNKRIQIYVNGGINIIGKVMSFVGIAMLTKSVLAYEDNGALRSRVWNWIPKLWTFKG